MRYSVRMGCLIITLLMSLNSFQSSSLQIEKNYKKIVTYLTVDELTQHCGL